MTEAELRPIVARNIAACRKQAGMTQAELAEKLNYSDKTISKWERAEGLPDLVVSRRMILLMSVSLCWLVATIAYFALKLAVPTLPHVWLAFIYALPASFIVCTVFTCIWWKKLWRLLSISGIIWTLAVAVHISIRLPAIYLIYVVAAVVQALFLMFFHFLRIK